MKSVHFFPKEFAFKTFQLVFHFARESQSRERVWAAIFYRRRFTLSLQSYEEFSNKCCIGFKRWKRWSMLSFAITLSSWKQYFYDKKQIVVRCLDASQTLVIRNMRATRRNMWALCKSDEQYKLCFQLFFADSIYLLEAEWNREKTQLVLVSRPSSSLNWCFAQCFLH